MFTNRCFAVTQIDGVEKPKSSYVVLGTLRSIRVLQQHAFKIPLTFLSQTNGLVLSITMLGEYHLNSHIVS